MTKVPQSPAKQLPQSPAKQQQLPNSPAKNKLVSQISSNIMEPIRVDTSMSGGIRADSMSPASMASEFSPKSPNVNLAQAKSTKNMQSPSKSK